MEPENQFTKNKTLILIVAIILVGGATFFIIKDKREDTSSNTENESGLSDDLIYTIEPVSTSTNSNIQKPSLDRRNNFETADANSKKKIEEISSALKTNGGNLSLWVDLGSWRKTIGDYEGAKVAWEYVVKVNPNYIVPLINLGDLYQYYLKDNVKAEMYLKRAIAKDPSNIDSYYRLASLYTLSYKEKATEASKVLLQGLNANPKNVDMMIMLAEYYRDIGDKNNAIIYYDKAISELNRLGDNARMIQVKSARDAI